MFWFLTPAIGFWPLAFRFSSLLIGDILNPDDAILLGDVFQLQSECLHSKRPTVDHPGVQCLDRFLVMFKKFCLLHLF